MLRMSDGRRSADQITPTVATLLAECCKTSERTVFWNDDLKLNVDPFLRIEGNFFMQDWDFKVSSKYMFGRVYCQIHIPHSAAQLKVLRQLVELQLEHNVEIKNTIDLAWGVQHNKHKKKEAQDAPPDPSDPKSKQRLQLNPIGQDTQRKRYWVVDGPCIFSSIPQFCICAYLGDDAAPIFIALVHFRRPPLGLCPICSTLLLTFPACSDSPRIYISTNPWKMAATFQTISSTREEYVATIESIKASGPTEPKGNEKRSKAEQNHLALVKALEDRLEAVDNEINVSTCLQLLFTKLVDRHIAVPT